jgi:hypothetical protein
VPASHFNFFIPGNRPAGIAQTAAKFSFEGYLAGEGCQAEKHESARGATFAMAGARREHAAAAMPPACP